jgi:hypothetical protein
MVILQLLNDNEATVMRLTEQAKILKEEIRRMERNQKREEETSNMEYLKNILLKVSVCSICNTYTDFYISTIIVSINIVYMPLILTRPG